MSRSYIPFQKSHFTKLFQKNRGIPGVCACLLSLLLGYWAFQLSKESALQDWQAQYPPSILLWKKLMSANGFISIEDPKAYHRMLRTVPHLSASREEVWIDSTEGLVLLVPSHMSSTANQEPIIFSCHSDFTKNKNPPAWEPINRGWLALEKLVERSFLSQACVQKLTRSTIRPVGDPRELRY